MAAGHTILVQSQRNPFDSDPAITPRYLGELLRGGGLMRRHTVQSRFDHFFCNGAVQNFFEPLQRSRNVGSIHHPVIVEDPHIH